LNTTGKTSKNLFDNKKRKQTKNKQKGIIFSTDAGISFAIMLISCFLMVITIANNTSISQRNIKNFELEEKALLIADSLVKNLDEENPLLGACIYDTDKKRVLSNSLSEELIKKAKSLELENFFVKKITILSQQKTELILSSKESIDCITAKRFALVDKKKSIIEVQTCRQ